MQPGRKLSSWKEIASYLKISVRTAQSWEQERGLPVVRVPGEKRVQVFAIAEDLDRWAGQGPLPPQTLNQAHSGLWIAATVAALVAVSAGWMLLRTRSRPAVLIPDLQGFVAADAEGNRLWRWTGPEQLQVSQYQPQGVRKLHFLADLDGDGSNEAVFGADYVAAGQTNSEVICFSSTGSPRWKFQPGRPVRAGTEDFAGRFLIEGIQLAHGRGGRLLVVVASRHWNFYPAQIAVLDIQGKLLREYWHSGGFAGLAAADLDQDGRDEIYLGGTDNGLKRATLLVLDPEELDGAADETANPDFQLLGFAPGRERMRIVFPDSCVSRASAYRPDVENMSIVDGGIELAVRHAVSGYRSATVHYRVDSRGMVRHIALGDGYLDIHARLESEGRIRHHFDEHREKTELQHVEFLAPPSQASGQRAGFQATR